MARHEPRDPRSILVSEPFLGEHEGDLGLGLARALVDLVALAWTWASKISR